MVGKTLEPVTLPLILHSPKTLYVALTGIGIGIVAVATDSSPATPWILGALLPISGSILLLLYKIGNRLSVLEIQVTPLWATLQKQVADALHHPHSKDKETDGLLEKLEALTLTQEERGRLEVLLKTKTTNPEESDQEKKRADLLLFLMPRAVQEEADKHK